MAEKRRTTSGVNRDAARELRRRAEELLQALPPDIEAMAPEEVLSLVHELHMHQIELEMQNEELRRSTAALESSRDRYTRLYEHAPVAYFTLHDEMGCISEANLTAAALLGTERDELVGRLLSRFVTRDSQEAYFDFRRRLIENEGPQSCEVRLVRRGGPDVDVQLSGVLVPSPDAPLVCQVTATDVTALRDLPALRASERRERQRAEELDTLLAAVPTPVIIVHDPDGLHMTGNRAADELLRLPSGAEVSVSAPDEVKPRHFKPMKDGRELALDELPAQRAARGEEVRDFEFSLVFEDGTVRELLGYGTPLRDEEGRPRGAVHTLVDITARKTAEEALRRAAQFPKENPSPVLRIDLDGALLYANDAAYAWLAALGWQEGAAVPDALAAVVTEAVNSGTPAEAEVCDGTGTAFLAQAMRPPGERYANVHGRDITTRKLAEEALRATQQRLQAVLDAAPIGVCFSTDASCRRIVGNHALYELLDIGSGQDLSTIDADLNTVARRLAFFRDGMALSDRDMPLQRAVAENRVIAPLEVEIELPGGRRFTAEVSAAPLHDAAGGVIAGVCTVTDITERRQAEDALRLSEERYRSLFESMIEGFCVIEVVFDAEERPIDYRFLEINPAFEAQTGLHDARGRLMRDLAPEHEAHWFEIYGRVALTGEPAHFVNEAKALNRWYDVRAYRVGAPDLRRLAILFNDVTDRKRAEDAIRQQARLLDLSHDAIFVWEVGGAIEYWNEGAEQLYGYRREEAVGRVTHDLLATLHPDGSAAYLAALERDGVWRGELSHRTKDGRRVTVESSHQLVVQDGRRLVLETTHDITARKQAEAWLATDLAALTRLHDLSTTRHLDRPLDTMLQHLVDAAVAIVGAERGMLRLIVGDALRIVAQHGHEAVYLDFQTGNEQTVFHWYAERQWPDHQAVEDVELEPSFVGEWGLDVMRAAGVRAWYHTLLRGHDGEPLGVLTTNWSVPHAPDEHERWRLDLLARQAADAIEARRAEAQLAADLDALTRLHALSATSHRTEPSDTLPRDIMEAAVAMVGADLGVLRLVDGDRLRVAAHHGHEPAFLDFCDRHARSDLAWHEANHWPAHLTAADVEHSPLADTPWLDALRRAGVRAVHTVPLICRAGKPQGTLIVEWRTLHTPDEHELWRLDLLARQSADTLEARRAEEQIAADLDALKRMHALSTASYSSARLDAMFQDVVDTAVAIAGAERGMMHLADGERLRIVAHHGEAPPVPEFCAAYTCPAACCHEAFRSRHPVTVEDIEASPSFAGSPVLDVFRSVGIRAVHATPMIGRDGSLVGVLTVHWSTSRTPSDALLQRLELLARQTADTIEAKRADEALHALNESLEARVAERTQLAVQRAAQLRELVAQLVAAEAKERARIARLLHDDLQQVLVAARIHTELLRADSAGTPVAKASEGINEMLGVALRMSRELTSELVIPVPDEAGLPASLAWLARDCEAKHGLCVDFIAGDVEPVAEPMRTLFFQAARELLFNVVKHAGVETASVTLDRDSEGRTCVTVADTGRGFDPEAASRLTAGGVSTGFGLFSIQERLQLVGGELRLFTRPGAGTLAVVLGPPRDGEATRPEVDAPDGPPDEIGVLIADDNADLRRALVSLLGSEAGMRVLGEAADGHEAVAQVHELRPHVVLMDVSMPHLDGIEACRMVTSQLPRVRVIGLSMFDDAHTVARMSAAGAVSFLTKSAPSEDLLAAIRAAVGAAPPS
jgi:PAS domain S-box-containing protein